MNRADANGLAVPFCDRLRVQTQSNGLVNKTNFLRAILGVLWLISASTVAAQVTVVQTPSVACGSVSSCTIVFPKPVQAADAIWIVTDYAGTSLKSVVDTLSSQYSILGSVVTSPDNSWHQIAAWAQLTAAGSLSITVSLTGTSPFMELYAFDLRGATLDAHTSASGVAGTIFAPISVTTANEVAVATIISGGTANAGAGFTLASNLDNNLAEWTRVPNAGTANITASSNAVWAMNAATFKQSSTAVAPSITTQPSNRTVTAGQMATFSVVAAGTAPLKYQWQKKGGSITGANSSSYTTPATLSSDNGATFRVIVSNSAGSVTSNAATLTVLSGGSIATATVNASSPGLVIPASFGGITLFAIQDANDLMGTAAAPNPIYRQLIKNLIFPGQQFIITTEDDQGETAAPTATQVSALGQLYTDLKNSGFTVGIYPGIPLCPNSTTLATGYATAWINDMPSGSMLGMVIGNEPDGPCREGTYADFLSKFQTWTSDINALPGGAKFKFMGPQFGGQLPWQFTGPDLNPFIDSEASVLAVVGQHWYPLIGNAPCHGGNASIPGLLSTSAATSASSIISSYVRNAHSKGLTFRISEMNSADCSGVPGVSDTFASALWVMDGLFHLTNVGVDGVNIVTDEGDDYDLFGFTTTSAPYRISFIAPEYYGTLVFQQATQNKSKLLPVTLSTSSNISVWATVDASNTARVLVINKDESASGNINITLSGFGNGTLSRLAAPSVSSKTGVTWAGQTFDGSPDGTIQGTESSTTVVPNLNMYTFSISPTSAALLTVSHQ